MLPLRFDGITTDHIAQLVADKVSERKTLEYKKALNIGNTEDKAEFLADVSSFANASGGDLLFGITDERGHDGNATGVPDEVVGIAIPNPGTECNRIEQLIQTGLQPRLPILFVKAFDVEGKSVIVIRVGKSWASPHMVSYANRTRFFSRNSSSGKVLLDVHQIGAAFAEQRAIGERLRTWKADRISKAISGEGPVGLTGARLLFHFVPASALTTDGQSLPRMFDTAQWVRRRLLMSLSPEYSRYNADGFLLTSKSETAERGRSYLQVFKDGALEYGDSYVLKMNNRDSMPVATLEERLVSTFEQSVALLKDLDVSPPLYVSLTLIGVKGARFATPSRMDRDGESSDPIDREVVVCPDVEVQQFTEERPYQTTLLPIVNSIWQAAGIAQSLSIIQDKWQVWNRGF
jgi:hypothetical protein